MTASAKPNQLARRGEAPVAKTKDDMSSNDPTTPPPSSATRNGWRDADEIQRIIDLRYERALSHFKTVARGQAPRSCPICGYSGIFSPVRHKVDVWCPSCDSRSRHRLTKLWAAAHLTSGQLGATLHFAAEECLQGLFREMSQKYVTADLNPIFDLVLDIEAIDLPDTSFDLVIANHVLEHVNDTVALAEMRRILKPGGRMLITVPIIEGWDETFEDPGGLTDERRTLVMSDPDHRRWYGRDIRDKIAEAGFTVSEFTAQEPEVTNHGISRGEKLFLGTVPD